MAIDLNTFCTNPAINTVFGPKGRNISAQCNVLGSRHSKYFESPEKGGRVFRPYRAFPEDCVLFTQGDVASLLALG